MRQASMLIPDLKLRWKQTILIAAAALGILAVGVVGIYDLHQSVHEERRVKAREMADIAIQLIERIDSRVTAGEISLAEAQKQAADGLRAMRYGDNGYFWVQDPQSRLLIHPFRRDLENIDMISGPDPFLRIVAEKTLSIVNTSGGGFITYNWPKPGSTSPAPKISFVRRYAPWGWIVGTGIYIDDIDTMVRGEAAFAGGIGLVILAAVLAWSMWISRGITAPLATLSHSMVQLTEGKVSLPLRGMDRRDEIGDLARAFNFFRQKTIEMDRLRIEKEVAQDRERQTLRESEGRYRMLVEQSPDAVLVHRDDITIFANNVAAHLFGAEDPMQLIGLDIGTLIDPSSVDHAKAQRKLVRESGNLLPLTEFHYRKLTGESFVAEATAARVLTDNAFAVHTVIRDVTERRRAEEKFRQLSRVVEQSPTLVVITDANGDIEYVNPTFEQVSGYTSAEVIGRNPRILKSGTTSPKAYEELWRTIAAGHEWHGELCNRKKDGSFFWEYSIISPITGDDGQITHYVAVKEDITVRKNYEERLLHQANHDALTDLPNRALAMDRLSQAVKRARRLDRSVALMCIDIDDFKKINDTFGHAAGDNLLIEVAERLKGVVREGETVARMEGDVFVIILSDLEASIHVEVATRRLVNAFADPFLVEGHEIVLTASVGQTLSPADGSDPQILMRNAQSALYRAKAAGRNTCRYFTPHMNTDARNRIQMESLLRRAIENNELAVQYQPVIDAASGEWVGAEALMRWHNPQLGTIPPNDFIPLAEESDLIVGLGEWILEKACHQASAWNRGRTDPLRIAVNVSARQLKDASFAETVARILQETGLPADRLDLEITERLLLDQETETGRIIDILDGMGIGLSIDDFGTGYSALTYLKRFPTDVLKIDRSFIRNLESSATDDALVKAMIAMAHCLGIKVIGEGVETAAQAAILRSAGCDFFQGYLYGKPMSAEGFTVGLGSKVFQRHSV